jgi:hypothetical protein
MKESYDTDFINSQLNDTRYIAKLLHQEYLTKICNKFKLLSGVLPIETVGYEWPIGWW